MYILFFADFIFFVIQFFLDYPSLDYPAVAVRKKYSDLIIIIATIIHNVIVYTTVYTQS